MWLHDDATPPRVLRWEPDADAHDDDGGMLLRTDDDRSQEDAWHAMYWRDPGSPRWDWTTPGCCGGEGECATADEARRACELAVLHQEVR